MWLPLMRFCLLIQEERTPSPGLLALSMAIIMSHAYLSFRGHWEIKYIGFSPSKVEEDREKGVVNGF